MSATQSRKPPHHWREPPIGSRSLRQPEETLCTGVSAPGRSIGSGHLNLWRGMPCQGWGVVWWALRTEPPTITHSCSGAQKICPPGSGRERARAWTSPPSLSLTLPSTHSPFPSPLLPYESSGLEEKFCLPEVPSDHPQSGKGARGQRCPLEGTLNCHHPQ